MFSKINTNKKPLVSVLICVYNAECFLHKTIRSVLEQTYCNLEILILNNNSKDDSLAVINEFASNDNRIRVFNRKENLGAYGGLNFLLQNASGKYIAILDHDDIWHPEKTEAQISFLLTHDQFIGCGANALKYFESEKKYKIISKKKKNTRANHCSLMFRNRHQRYDTRVKYKTDVYFMHYILCNQKPLIFNLNQALYIHRIRADKGNLNKSWNTYNNALTYFRKTKDFKTLIISSVKRILPDRIMSMFEKIGAKNIRELGQNPLERKYLEKGFLP